MLFKTFETRIRTLCPKLSLVLDVLRRERELDGVEVSRQFREYFTSVFKGGSGPMPMDQETLDGIYVTYDNSTRCDHNEACVGYVSRSRNLAVIRIAKHEVPGYRKELFSWDPHSKHEDVLSVVAGCPLVGTDNDYVQGVINGGNYRFQSYDSRSDSLRVIDANNLCDNDGEEETMDMHRMSYKLWHPSTVPGGRGHGSTVSQFPVQLGYAVTAYKAQGQTYAHPAKVFVQEKTRKFGGGFLTAISRAQFLDQLYVDWPAPEPFNVRKIMDVYAVPWKVYEENLRYVRNVTVFEQ